MSKEITQIIDNFSKGMINNPRISDFSYSQLIKNFDAHNFSKKLVPFRDSESGDSGASTSQKQNFAVAIRTGTTYKLFALGVKSGAATAEVLFKDLGTGVSSSDFDDAGWTTPNNNQSASGAAEFNLFIYYKKTALIYGSRAGRYIWTFDPTSVAAFNDSELDLSAYTNIAQGLVHSKDDILYVPYDNKIAKNNNGSWTAAALTLPSHLYITSICEYGNYLAIACAPLNGVGNSRVYLWDRDATLATLSDTIDWGTGILQVLEEVEGKLIGISYFNGFKGKIIFKQYIGSGIVKTFNQFISEAVYAGGDLPIAKQKVDNYLYFLLTITLNGVKQQGLWKIGRNIESDNFVISMDRPPNNDTVLTSGSLKNFFVYEDYVFISYVDNGTYALSKTNDQASFTATSIYESLVINGGDSSKKKKLIGVSVMTEYLPTAGQVVLKYKIDNETSFTTIFTNTTDNSISYSAVNIESSGANLPEFKELVLRVESTGNAVITALKYKLIITGKDKYE